MVATETWINDSIAELAAEVGEAQREMGVLELVVADLADAIREHCAEVTA